MDKKKIAVIQLVLGAIGLIVSAIIISNDMTRTSYFSTYYTYQPPFTPHEFVMICVAGGSIGLLIGGTIGWHKNK